MSKSLIHSVQTENFDNLNNLTENKKKRLSLLE